MADKIEFDYDENHMCQRASELHGVGEKNGAYKDGYIDGARAHHERTKAQVSALHAELDKSLRYERETAIELHQRIAELEAELAEAKRAALNAATNAALTFLNAPETELEAENARLISALSAIAGWTDLAFNEGLVTFESMREQARAALRPGGEGDEA